MLINLPSGLLYDIKYKHEMNPIQSSFGMHAHSHYEILLFISGDITYLVEGNSYKPRPFDIFLFDIAETHKVVLHSEKPYERMVIQIDKNILSNLNGGELLFSHFQGRVLGENNVLHASDFPDELWRICLERLKNSATKDKNTVFPFLLPLLAEINHAFLIKKSNSKDTTPSAQIVQYVNANITNELSVESISQRFLISRTALYTLFRNATGTGIHDYINVKRLIMARDFIKDGIKPTEAFEMAGFKDYSAFYRAYKKLFLKSPKEDMQSYTIAKLLS